MNNFSSRVFVVASAGGHLTQALCATSLCENIILFSNKRINESGNITRVHRILDTQFNPIYHALNFLIALCYIIRYKPKSIFSTGGPKSLSFALSAKLLGVKFVYLDTLSRVTELSNTAKFIIKYKLSEDIFSQWEQVAIDNNINYMGKCFDVTSSKQKYEVVPHYTKDPMVFVTVGTSEYKFSRLFDIISSLDIYNDKRVNWIIQAGNNKIEKLPVNSKVYKYIDRDTLENIVKKSSLVISHCGIGSINLSLAYGKKTIYIPRLSKYNEFSDDHQLQIASELSNELFIIHKNESKLVGLDYSDICSFPIFDAKLNIIDFDFCARLKVILVN